MTLRTLASCCLLIGLLSTSGCSKPTGPLLVPVVGKVTLDGSPLEGAGVSFRPDATRGNTIEWQPSGSCDKEGKFELTTTAKKGAPPGWYKVVVIPYSPPPGGEAPKAAAPTFDKKFLDPKTTSLSIEVKAGAAAGAYDLQLTK